MLTSVNFTPSEPCDTDCGRCGAFIKGKELVRRGEIGYLRGLCVSVMGAYLLTGVAAVYAVAGGSVGRQVAAVFDVCSAI